MKNLYPTYEEIDKADIDIIEDWIFYLDIPETEDDRKKLDLIYKRECEFNCKGIYGDRSKSVRNLMSRFD
jgi:hypothetical protein